MPVSGTLAARKLQARFPEDVLEVSTFREQTTVTLRVDALEEAARFLRDDPELRYVMLTDVCGVDYGEGQMAKGGSGGGTGESASRFAVVYHLTSLEHGQRLRLRVPAEGNPPTVPTVTSIWPGANWPEREAYDLMGIHFRGHPDLRRILLPDEWQGHPLRKDYPLGGEPVAFSVNQDLPELQSLGQQILDIPSKPPELPPGANPEYMIINMGPQHPSTHGVLRLVLELDGERIRRIWPDIGHLHSGIEKTAEHKTYQQVLPYTDRMDYVAAFCNNLSYVLAVEKLLDVEVPPRARYIRVILAELQRIASHLIWLGTHCLDLSGIGMSLLAYVFRDREELYAIFEMVSGARQTPSYFCVGGLRWDVPEGFVPAVRRFINAFPARLKDYETMLTDNPIWRGRTEGVGVIDAETALAMGVTGPILRATGVAYDLRKFAPYSGYDEFEFDIPTETAGDCYARYLVRLEEMRQSVRIIQQALERLPDGLIRTADYKVALPPREELSTSVEALIHHFKLVTEGFHPPAGEIYSGAENPKGELGFYIISDGSPKPYRLRVRSPSFMNLQAMPIMAQGAFIADIVAIIGSIDIVMGEVDR